MKQEIVNTPEHSLNNTINYHNKKGFVFEKIVSEDIRTQPYQSPVKWYKVLFVKTINLQIRKKIVDIIGHGLHPDLADLKANEIMELFGYKECYKTGLECKYNCSGLCKDSC